MEEVLTIRLPKGTRRRLERRARAQNLSVSQLVRRALEQDEFLASLVAARTELRPQARAQGIYTVNLKLAMVPMVKHTIPMPLLAPSEQRRLTRGDYMTSLTRLSI